MRATFGAPVGDLGLTLLLGTAGSVLVTAFRLAPASTPARPGPGPAAHRPPAALDGYRVGSVTYCRPDGAVHRTYPLGSCSAFQRGCCCHPVVVAAFRVRVTHTRPPARLVRHVVFEIAPPGGPPATRPGTPRVPDLRQVPEHHPGIMPPGLPPVITLPGRQRPDLDQHLPLPGGEPPRPVPAGMANGGKREPDSARRIMPDRFASPRGSGAAVPDRVPVLVGDRHAPGRPRVTRRGGSQVPGQVRVDGINPVHLAGLVPRTRGPV